MNRVRITEIKGLKKGKPNHCHQNAFYYCLDNDCKFVCGWLIEEGINIPHCICEKDGVYIDPTLNKEKEFKIYYTYTKEEIYNIFRTEESFFIPFQGNYKSIYDGTRKLNDEEARNWLKYLIKVEMEGIN